MKVVLLAGGLGTRISEESQYKPKPMIPSIVISELQ
jgi:glucose-1-phosphate cytidylyltransferase